MAIAYEGTRERVEVPETTCIVKGQAVYLNRRYNPLIACRATLHRVLVNGKSHDIIRKPICAASIVRRASRCVEVLKSSGPDWVAESTIKAGAEATIGTLVN